MGLAHISICCRAIGSEQMHDILPSLASPNWPFAVMYQQSSLKKKVGFSYPSHCQRSQWHYHLYPFGVRRAQFFIGPSRTLLPAAIDPVYRAESYRYHYYRSGEHKYYQGNHGNERPDYRHNLCSN